MENRFQLSAYQRTVRKQLKVKVRQSERLHQIETVSFGSWLLVVHRSGEPSRKARGVGMVSVLPCVRLTGSRWLEGTIALLIQ